jgi:transcription antitermination factor NusG
MSSAIQSFAHQTAVSVLANQPRWYAVHTRSRHEKKVAVELEEKGITAYVPLLNQVRRWSDRRKLIQTPLFSCYTFIHAALVPEVHAAVVRVPGVLAMVGSQHHAIPIPDIQIENIRTLLAHNISLTPYSFLKVGQRVRIRGGVLDGVEGILLEGGSRRLVISVESIHHSLSISVEGHNVEAI